MVSFIAAWQISLQDCSSTNCFLPQSPHIRSSAHHTLLSLVTIPQNLLLRALVRDLEQGGGDPSADVARYEHNQNPCRNVEVQNTSLDGR